jgi:hypothetical protein
MSTTKELEIEHRATNQRRMRINRRHTIEWHLNMRKFRQQVGGQLHAMHDALAAGRKEDEDQEDIWWWLGLLLTQCLPCDWGYRCK